MVGANAVQCNAREEVAPGGGGEADAALTRKDVLVLI